MQNVLWECVLASFTRSQVETLDVKICVRFLTHPRCLCTVRRCKTKIWHFFHGVARICLVKIWKITELVTHNFFVVIFPFLKRTRRLHLAGTICFDDNLIRFLSVLTKRVCWRIFIVNRHIICRNEKKTYHLMKISEIKPFQNI